MKIKFLLYFICLALFSATPANASYAPNSKIAYIIVTPGGNVFFKAGAQVSAPACSTTNEFAFQVVGTDASGGKAMLASLLAAQAQNKDVFVSGLGTCEIGGNRETVGYIVVYS